MIPNLSDFKKDELQVLLNSIVRSKLAVKERIDERAQLYKKADAEYPMQVPSVSEDHKEYETLCLWHVQLLNAIGKVSVREEIMSC